MELYTDDTIRDYDSNRLGIGKLDATMTLANSKSHGSGLDIIYKKITVCGGSCCTFASDGTNAGMYNVFRQGELSSGSRIRVRTTGCSASGPVTAACLYDMAGLYTSDEKFATSECAAIPSDAAMTDGYEEIISDDEYQVRVSGQEDVECTGEGIDYGLAGPYTVEICGIGFSPNCDPEPTCESTCEKLCQSLTPPKNFPAGSCPCDVNACVCI
jgi:hypothetical protein